MTVGWGPKVKYLFLFVDTLGFAMATHLLCILVCFTVMVAMYAGMDSLVDSESVSYMGKSHNVKVCSRVPNSWV